MTLTTENVPMAKSQRVVDSESCHPDFLVVVTWECSQSICTRGSWVGWGSVSQALVTVKGRAPWGPHMRWVHPLSTLKVDSVTESAQC